jgi:adenylate cyclase
MIRGCEEDGKPCPTTCMAAFWESGRTNARLISAGGRPRSAHVHSTCWWHSPTRPSVAVLPFDTHHAEEAYFGDGMTEDIITALSANHGLFVIARNSTLRYRGSTSRPDQIAAELGVRYLVFGSVRRAEQKLRVGAELVEASSGQILWADHFEGVGDDLFEFQARIASRIAPLIDARVEQVEIAEASMRPPRNLSAYDCLLRRLATLHSFADGGFEQSGDLLRRAIELDTGDALALSVAGHAEACVRGNFDAAMALFDQALSIRPGCTVAWGRSAALFASSGDGEEALRRADIAMRLSPFDPLGFTFCTTSGTACLVLGRDDEAVTWLARARWLNPGYRAAWRLLIAALALAGKGDEARAQATQFMQAEPTFSVSAFAARCPLRQPHLSRILDGMRSVGLPD